MTHKVRLTKIKSSHSNLRTDVIEGETRALPAIGSGFVMFGKGLEYGTRMVYTTAIQSLIRTGDEIQFETANSTYLLEVLTDQPTQ